MTYQDQLPGLFKQIPYVRNFRDLRIDFRDTLVSVLLIKYLLLFTKAVTIFKLLHLKVSNFVFEQEISNEKNLYKISKVQKWSEIMFFFLCGISNALGVTNSMCTYWPQIYIVLNILSEPHPNVLK